MPPIMVRIPAIAATTAENPTRPFTAPAIEMELISLDAAANASIAVDMSFIANIVLAISRPENETVNVSTSAFTIFDTLEPSFGMILITSSRMSHIKSVRTDTICGIYFLITPALFKNA